jgi:hypothetical protein
VTALEQIQNFRSTAKCTVLPGGAIWGRVFYFIIGLLSTHYFLVMSLLLNSATKKLISLLRVGAVPHISKINKYDNQSDSQDN